MSFDDNKNIANGSVQRHKKDESFTILANDIFLDNPPLSLEAKGLLCQMFSLPDSWNHSIAGYRKLCNVGERKIKNILKELKERGYLIIEKVSPKNSGTGRFAYVYHVYDEKQKHKKQEGQNVPLENEKQEGHFVPLEFQPLQIQPLQNGPLNKIINNKELNNKENNNKNNEEKKFKSSFGEFNNVFLTQKEQTKLITIYGDKFNEAVEILGSYKESKGKKYKSDYAVLGEHNWVFKKIFPNGKPQNQINQPVQGGKYAKCYETGVC